MKKTYFMRCLFEIISGDVDFKLLAKAVKNVTHRLKSFSMPMKTIVFSPRKLICLTTFKHICELTHIGRVSPAFQTNYPQ